MHRQDVIVQEHVSCIVAQHPAAAGAGIGAQFKRVESGHHLFDVALKVFHRARTVLKDDHRAPIVHIDSVPPDQPVFLGAAAPEDLPNALLERAVHLHHRRIEVDLKHLYAGTIHHRNVAAVDLSIDISAIAGHAVGFGIVFQGCSDHLFILRNLS